MARALIVGCGCRGQALARALAREGWTVRGTSRGPERLEEIASTGIEAVEADPDRVGTLLELLGDVTLVYWLMGSALGEPEVIAAIHGPRLERFMEKLVDTPVRGVVYEAAGGVQQRRLEEGAAIVRGAGATWNVPIEIVENDPADHAAWVEAMLAAARRLLG